MAIKVYIATDREAIRLIEEEDIDGFRDYLTEDEFPDFVEPIIFETETEAMAFCSGIGFGKEEHYPPAQYPLRSSEASDLPFIEAIETR